MNSLMLAIPFLIAPLAATVTDNSVAPASEPVAIVASAEDLVAPALLTQISVSITIDGNNLYAVAKNEFTFLSSTVQVVLKLYSSDTPVDSVSDMTMVGYSEIDDLDMGKELKVKAICDSTKYWKAAATVTENNGTPTTIETKLMRYDDDGNVIYCE